MLGVLLRDSRNEKKKGSFILINNAKTVFRVLKEVFTEAPVLLHFNSKKPIHLETDSSRFALVGIMS